MKGTSQDRSEIVLEQANIMLTLIEQNKDNQNLQKIILNHAFPDGRSLKPDAIKLVIDYLTENNYSPNLIKVANEVLIERRIGQVKDNNNLEQVSAKQEGQASGRVVKKQNKDLQIMQKKDLIVSGPSEGEKRPDAIAFEYLGSQLANLMMPDASPKVKLHQDPKTKEVTLLSTYLKDFTPIATLDKDGTTKIHQDWQKFQANPVGFGKLFAANFLLGDNDLNAGNVDTKLRRIDFGQALDFKGNYTPDQLQKRMLSTFDPLYTQEMFKGTDFAKGILEFTRSIDLLQYRQAIKASLKNIQDAYGKDFFDNEDFKEEVRSRLGIPKNTKLTAELLENHIISNFEKQIASLEQTAQKKLRIANIMLLPDDEQTVGASEESKKPPIQKAIDENSLEQIFKLTDKEKRKDINGMSPLKYAIAHKKYELMGQMVKLGFSLNENEKAFLESQKQNKELLEKSNNLLRRTFKSLTKNDLKRLEIISGFSGDELKNKKIDLANKPSPLYIAIETGQLKLAKDMLEHGFTLKQSEINNYMKGHQQKQGIKSRLGFRKSKRSLEVIDKKIKDSNALLLHQPKIKSKSRSL